jgi:outer membrane protein OmpA-like peptidoglycan-associated protein
MLARVKTTRWVAVVIGLCALLSVAAAQGEDCEKAKQYYSLGTKLSKYEERRAAFEKAVQLCQSFVEAHVNLADAYEHLAEQQKDDATRDRELSGRAIEHYRKAVELNPEFFIAYVGLGEVYWALGQYPDAKQAYEKALQLQPNFQRAKDGLEAVQTVMANDEALRKIVASGGVMRADLIVREVTTSTLEGMGPGTGTVPRARIRFPNIIFDGWSSKISRRESLEQLKEIGRALSSKDLQGYSFWIEGHANTVGLEERDGAARLKKLSEERSEAVKRFLVREFGIPSNTIVARGFGCTRPLFLDDSDEHKEQNRRVEIVFRKSEKD